MNHIFQKHIGLIFWTQVLIVIFLVPATHAQSPKRLWVLQEPGKIVEYDITTFAELKTQKVFHCLIEQPKYLRINAKGQMLFLPPHGVFRGGKKSQICEDRVWFRDGHRDKEWFLKNTKTKGGHSGKNTVKETVLRGFLSADTESLFWFENIFETVKGESNRELSVLITSKVWQTGLDGASPLTIKDFASPRCDCGTGVCSETCPEWDFWTPDGVVGNVFLMTNMTPGQIATDYHESLLFQRSGQGWQVRKLPEPVTKPLTASANGDILIVAIEGLGCCGWDNEGSDRILMLKKDKVFPVYDEFERYDNRNYDVSFFATDAKLSPDNEMLAYTLVSTARATEEIRLSSEGKENPEELIRIRKTIAELPAIDVVKLGTKPRPVTMIHQATLVGWLSENEILVVQDGHLAVYNILGNKRQDTSIRVRSIADVFLR